MNSAARRLQENLPFLFGIGFIAPLVKQIMPHIGLYAVWDVPPITVGLVIGATWGGLANWRGRWL